MMEKQQVLFIHGGEPDVGYDDYIDRLKNGRFELALEDPKTWNKNQRRFLDTDIYDVITPTMPCGWKAHYSEWKIWFERHIEFLRDDVILSGHSLGGNFLAKWLSENMLPVEISQLHLIAAPHSKSDSDFKITEFPKNLFENKIQEIHIYHSTDDTVVRIEEAHKYYEALPGSHLHIFEDRFHFLEETFPELFENIQSIQNKKTC